MRRIFTTILFSTIAILSLSAQSGMRNEPTSSGFDKSKLTFGGGLGLQFGDYTVINIAPQVGYNFSEKFNAGAGIFYSYYKEDYYSGVQKYTQKRNYVGMNVYAKVYPIQNIVLMVQPEASRVWYSNKYNLTGEKYSENKFVPVVLVGAGLRFGPMTAMLQYDLVQDEYSPYGNNIFYSIGYTFGF